MGFIIAKIYRKKEKNLLFLGLDGSGKTAILHSILKIASKPPQNLTLTPTMGFNAESFTYMQKKMLAWDLSGDDSVRGYWSCYYTNVNAVFYCLDQTDSCRYQQNLAILKDLSSKQELKTSLFVFLISKKDLPCKIDLSGLTDEINRLFGGRLYTIGYVSVYDAMSIRETMIWLAQNI